MYLLTYWIGMFRYHEFHQSKESAFAKLDSLDNAESGLVYNIKEGVAYETIDGMVNDSALCIR